MKNVSECVGKLLISIYSTEKILKKEKVMSYTQKNLQCLRKKSVSLVTVIRAATLYKTKNWAKCITYFISFNPANNSAKSSAYSHLTGKEIGLTFTYTKVIQWNGNVSKIRYQINAEVNTH